MLTSHNFLDKNLKSFFKDVGEIHLYKMNNIYF